MYPVSFSCGLLHDDEIINNLFIFGLLKRVMCQNKCYASLSVNIGVDVILGLPIMHCSHPNINKPHPKQALKCYNVVVISVSQSPEIIYNTPV